MARLFTAVAAAALTLGAVAVAQTQTQTWTDDKGRLSFDYPRGWPVDTVQKDDDGFVHLIVGPADAECRVFVRLNDNTEGKPAHLVAKAYATEFGNAKWDEFLTDFRQLDGKGLVVSSSLDTTRLWPRHRAQFTADDGSAAYGAMEPRPGFEYWQFCRSFDGKDRGPIFTAMADSMNSPRDAEWQAEADAALAQAAAPPPPPPPPPPAAQKKKRGDSID